MVRPSRRREMAKKAVTDRGVCIRAACDAFRISESCYRYERKLDAENDEVANWLIRLTDNHRNWGFGLCYLYLRNVKGFKWNHKRVYRINRNPGSSKTHINQLFTCKNRLRVIFRVIGQELHIATGEVKTWFFRF